MARGRLGLAMKLQIGGETFLVVPARDVLDVHDREDARRLLERAIVDRGDVSALRAIVEELPGLASMSCTYAALPCHLSRSMPWHRTR